MKTQLTTVSETIRQYGLSVIFGIIGVIVVWNLGKAGYQACCAVKVTPTPAAAPRFGKLERLNFVTEPPLSSGMRFKLETISGKLPPMASASASVFEVVKKTVGLDYAEKAQNAAEKAGLNNPIQEQLNETTFLFINPTDQSERFTYDFIYDNMNYEYQDLISYVSLERGSAPTLEQADSLAKNFITTNRKDIFAFEGRGGDTKYTPTETFYYLESATGEQTKVASQPQANITIVNYNRPPIGGIPIIGPSTTESLISFIHTGYTASTRQTQKKFRLLKASITYWPINPAQQTATYPLISNAEAWKRLEEGKAYVLSEKDTNEEMTIRKVYMAYFEPAVKPKYLQPVWVFEGDKPSDSKFLFRAIVPAVAAPYYE